MANENRLKATTSALTMLRRGWTLTTPDGKYEIVASQDKICVFLGGYIVGCFDKTQDGFEQMMNDVFNPHWRI